MLTAHLPPLVHSFLEALPTPDPTTTPPAPGGHLNTDGIVKFFGTGVAPILLAVLGIAILAGSQRGQVSKTFTMSGVALVGLAFLAGAGTLFAFGHNIIGLIFN
jgi:uncharacterized membrane protein